MIAILYKKSSEITVDFNLQVDFYIEKRKEYDLVGCISFTLPNNKTIEEILNYGNNKFHIISLLFPEFEQYNYKLDDFYFENY